ncbi:hypothetical protein GOV10_02265 [Candidatus Woesearchaeota archaeon]|nr:hypothetical protein [Candidatus Woesearchaeota archaeon]
MFEPIDREEVLRVIRQYGPLLPLDVKRRIGKGETTLIGAMLSELAHNKRVAITNLKRGSSPYYYDPNNPASLEQVAEYLGEKDRRTYALLKDKQVINAALVEPLTRVSLSNIKDYSRSFTYVINGETQTFYRYYLLSEEQAKQMIKEALKPKKKPVPTPKKKPKKTAKKVVQPKKSVHRPVKRKAPPIEEQTTLAPEEKPEMPDEPFFKRVVRYCKNKKIKIREWKVIRKGSELDFVVAMPTPVGRAEYFIKAKSKKKSNDGDIASALLAGQLRRLPVIYLTTGEVTKKAKEMTQSDLKGVLIKEIKA